MINIELLPIICKDCPFIIIEINKKKRLYTILDNLAMETPILPRISSQEREKLIQNEMDENIFKIFNEYYFIIESPEKLLEYNIPIVKKVASSYKYISSKSYLLPSKITRKRSFIAYKNLHQKINEKNIKKHLKKLENDILKQNNICAEVITCLSPKEIPDKYLIAYHNMSTYILIDKKRAQDMAKRNKGILRIYANEDYIRHIVGVKGKNIKRISKLLSIDKIVVKKITDL